MCIPSGPAKFYFALSAVWWLSAATAQAQERLAPVPPAQYTAEQAQAAKAFEAARQAPPSRPFGLMMRSPDLMTAARSMGDHLRYKSAIGNTLSEFTILVTAREWSQEYEWNIHAPIAAKQGIDPAKIDAIAKGKRPVGMTVEEAVCYDFVVELIRTKQVSDAIYARALKQYGEQGVVDLTGIAAYYSLLSMEMNVARTDPGGPLRLPKLPARAPH
jgi:4-carboxymuconolactone decarboxylase